MHRILTIAVILFPIRAWAGTTSNGNRIIGVDGGSPAVLNGRLAVDAYTSGSATNTYYSAVAVNVNANTSGTDNPILLLANRSTNTVNASLVRRVLGSVNNNVAFTFKMFYNPVIVSSGTSIPRTKIVAGGPTPQVEAYILPTVTSSGDIIDATPEGNNTPSAILDDLGIVSIGPGSSILFTTDPTTNNKSVYYTVWWYEK